MKRRMNIRQKLMLFLLIFAFITYTFGIGIVYVFNRTSANLEIIEMTSREHTALSDIKKVFMEYSSSVKRWTYTAEEEELGRYRVKLESMSELLKDLHGYVSDREALTEVNTLFKRLDTLAEKIVSSNDPFNDPHVTTLIRRFEEVEMDILKRLEDIYSISLKKLDGVVIRSEQLKQKLTVYIATLTIMMVFMTLFLLILIRKSVDKPFRRLIERIKEGDLGAIAREKGTDEFGMIAENYEQLLNRLEGSELTVKKRLAETEMLFELTSAATSAHRVKETLQISVETITERMRRDFAGVYVLNMQDQKFYLQALKSEAGSFREIFDKQSENFCLDMLKDTGPQYLENASGDELPILESKAGSLLLLPLMRDERCLGLLFIGSNRVVNFTDNEVNLATIIANTMTTVLSNAELYMSTAKHLKEITVLHKLSNALTTAVDLESLLKKAAYEVAILLNAKGCIVRLNEDGVLKIHSHYGVPEEMVKHMEIRVGEGFVGYVAETGKSALAESVDDLPEDQKITYLALKSIICAPLMISDDVVGTVGLYDKKTASGDIISFDRDDLKTVEGIASIISLAIEKVRLFELNMKQKIDAVEAKKRLDILFDSVQAGIVTLGRSYEIRAINWFAEELLQVKADEVTGLNAFELFHKSGGICPHCVADPTFETGESNFLTQTHASKFIELSSYPIKDSSGGVVETVVFLRNVTDMILYQEEILYLYKEVAQTKEYLESLIANSADAIVTADLNGIVKSWNSGAERIFGLGESEAKGKFMPFVPDSLIEKVGEDIRTIQEGTTIKDAEAVRKRKDGTLFEVSLTMSPIKDASGEVIGFSCISRDVSVKRKYEKELISKNRELSDLYEKVRMAEVELANIFESISDMLFITDKDCTIMNVNSAVVSRIGMDKEDIIGRKCYKVFHGTDKPYEKCPHSKTVDSNRYYIEEYEDEYLGGSFLASSSPVSDGTGNFRGTVHIVRDISEIKDLREKLSMTERMAALGEMAAQVAHEIRNPLVSIGGFSRRLERKLDGKLKEYASIINGEVGRLEEILQDTLRFARDVTLSKQKIDAVSIVNETLTLFSQEIVRKGILLETDLDKSIYLEVDPNRIKEALINLVSNAIQVLRDGQKLIVKTYAIADTGVIEVLDTGVGIKEKDMPSIFDPFFTTKFDGTGLGLAIAHRIVEEHGGKIKVTSRVGEGTSFKVFLPLIR